MTHKDIYTKFMIEYDKANVTSSYPSLTEYEVATILDKAYNALIAQKVTGNNVRRASFEADVKSISDLQSLVTTSSILSLSPSTLISNVKSTNLPSQFLYFVSAQVGYIQGVQPIVLRDVQNVKLVNHDIAQKFFQTNHNKPWVKEPVAFIEDGKFKVVYDPMVFIGGDSQNPSQSPINSAYITFIKKPNKFVKTSNDNISGYNGCFDWTGSMPTEYNFELNDTMAEELINLAITFALENVESQRLNTKLNTRGLEA